MLSSPADPGRSLVPVCELSVELAEWPEVVDDLLVRHLDDGGGHCAGCRLPQSGAPVWPCSLVLYARGAVRLRRARRLPARKA